MGKEVLDEREFELVNIIGGDLGANQRDLSRQMSLSLGMTNMLIRRLVSKGFIRISQLNKRKVKYILTPKGFAEKSRLTYALLNNYTRIFREARRDFSILFKELIEDGTIKVVFAGIDEVAEIAYLSHQEVDIDLVGVVDDSKTKENFFKMNVKPFEDIGMIDFDVVIVTTYLRRNSVYKKLLNKGVDPERIKTIYTIGVDDNFNIP